MGLSLNQAGPTVAWELIDMNSRKAVSIALLLTILSGSLLVYTAHIGLFSPATENSEVSGNITPHPFNALNWWDIPFELANISAILTPLIKFSHIGNRYYKTDGYYEAADYVISYFDKLSIEASLWGQHKSVVAYQKGYGNDTRALVFGAHLDTGTKGIGINQNAGGCAVVMTIAAILSHYRLPIDIYYAFFTGTMKYLDERSTISLLLGSREFAASLASQNVSVIAFYNFDELLYRDPEQPEEKRLIVEYNSIERLGYHRTKYLADLLQCFMARSGLNILSSLEYYRTQSDHLAFWENHMPAVNVRGGHIPNPDNPVPDSPNSSGYNLTQALDVAKAAASVAVYLGMQGNHQPTRQKLQTKLAVGKSRSMRAVMTVPQTIKLTGTATENSLSINVTTANGASLLSKVISEANFSFITEEAPLGLVTVTVRNIGTAPVGILLHMEYVQDTDGNGISDSDQYSWPDPISPLDWDHDGLPDKNETQYGTDIFVKDTDGDSINDYLEVINGLDPLRDDAQEDADNDGLSNVQEVDLGLSPNLNDTDSDSLPDGWEVEFHTDPLTPDANLDPDNDTLTNLEEFQYGSDPYSTDGDHDGLTDVEEVSLGLNPLSSDTDSDGLSDVMEIQNNLNPLVPDSDFDFAPDGSDPNPKVSLLLIFIIFTAVPVVIGSMLLWRRIK